MHIKIDVIAK